MTYRERRLARAQRLQGWADKRKDRAEAVLNHNSQTYRGDYAFNTQPGHIPARARVIAQDDRAINSLIKAERMEEKAGNIAAAVDRSIYNDDPDLIERLTAKIAGFESERELRKKANAAWKRGGKEELIREVGEVMAADGLRTMQLMPYNVPYPPYSMTNLGANIRNCKKRLAAVQRVTQ